MSSHPFSAFLHPTQRLHDLSKISLAVRQANRRCRQEMGEHARIGLLSERFAVVYVIKNHRIERQPPSSDRFDRQ